MIATFAAGPSQSEFHKAAPYGGTVWQRRRSSGRVVRSTPTGRLARPLNISLVSEGSIDGW